MIYGTNRRFFSGICIKKRKNQMASIPIFLKQSAGITGSRRGEKRKEQTDSHEPVCSTLNSFNLSVLYVSGQI
jgi:hypothetical protein